MTFKSLMFGAAAVAALPALSASAIPTERPSQGSIAAGIPAQPGKLIAQSDCYNLECPRHYGHSDRWRGKKPRRLQRKRNLPRPGGGGKKVVPGIIHNPSGGHDLCFRHASGMIVCPNGG